MIYLLLAVIVAIYLALGALCAWNLRNDDSFEPPAPRWLA